jgi:RecB family exonuclease
MESFLAKLAAELFTKFGGDFNGVTVVFPTRRAGLFFRAELAKLLDKPVWAPRVLAIQDLMLEIAAKSLPDPVTQLFELFDVYRTYFPEEEFDEYYPWGEVMLKDFDELDKSLSDPAKVFSIIADLKEIDASFALSEEEMDRLRSFWKHFFDKDSTRLKEEFAQTWRHLLVIYNEFHQRLSDKGWCTEGQAFRIVAEGVGNTDTIDQRIGRHVVFAGLYALSRSEEKVISYLLENNKASIYWDADEHYIRDHHQEAGHFLRSSTLFDKSSSNWIVNHLSGSKKDIEVIGIPMEVGQAKMAGHLVDELSRIPGFSPEKTAVVLPAEHLLFPVLYAMPESMEKINVTMGYPLHQTPIFYLFESLIALQRNARKSGTKKSTSFYFKDVVSILEHPYVRMIDRKAVDAVRKLLRDEKLIRITDEKIIASGNHELFSVIFRLVGDSALLFGWCREIMRLLLQAMEHQQFRSHRLEAEFVSRLFTQLNRLEEIYESVAASSTLETWWNLFNEIIRSTKIPFSGEPLEGLQVMGFLESRVIDFDNIILLSVNENHLPAAGQHPSFIPYGIRKAFGMPTHEDQHAVTAYHFYRLLQRASKIYLIHNTETQSITTGEPSRYIVQLEQELAARYPDTVSFSRRIIATPVAGLVPSPIIVEKTTSVFQRLERYFVAEEKESKYHPSLSPSAIAQFISCPLKFYFSYVAGLKEKEEKEEVMESAVLGNVLHKAMEILYTGKKSLVKTDFPELHKKVVAAVDEAIADCFANPEDLEGKNLLIRNVLQELTRRVLQLDEKDAPLEIVQLEKWENYRFALDEQRSVILGGFIDRVDRLADGLRVIDYKTGKVYFKGVKNPEDVFTDTSHKEQFQATLYAYLISKRFQGEPVKVGLITLREMSEGIKYLDKGVPATPQSLQVFESGLRGLLSNLFNPDIPFHQTEDLSQCTYCSFKDVCGR